MKHERGVFAHFIALKYIICSRYLYCCFSGCLALSFWRLSRDLQTGFASCKMVPNRRGICVLPETRWFFSGFLISACQQRVHDIVIIQYLFICLFAWFLCVRLFIVILLWDGILIVSKVQKIAHIRTLLDIKRNLFDTVRSSRKFSSVDNEVNGSHARRIYDLVNLNTSASTAMLTCSHRQVLLPYSYHVLFCWLHLVFLTTSRRGK